MGYAFAVTSYSKTGLAVVQGVADVVDLVDIFKKNGRTPGMCIWSGSRKGAWFARWQ